MKRFRFYAILIAMVTFVACSDDDVENIDKDKEPEFAGYWILSEGYSGQENSELAWYDVTKNEVAKKQFTVINGKPLGDTANELKLYGSKMYIVVTGGGFTPETSNDNSYIEVINPIDGKSIKRIPFGNEDGTPAKPRRIIFEGGYGYISSYSNEVVRLDTATLTLDKHAVLSGILAEGLTFNSGNIYVCNGGQGEDNKISVVDIETMKETDVIVTAKNPNKIVSVSNSDIYFNTDYPDYKLYKLIINKENSPKITEVPEISVADMTYINNNIYASFSDWEASAGEINQISTKTATSTKFNLDYESVNMSAMKEYHIGTINGSDKLYVTGTDEEVVIFDPATKEIKHAFKTGTPGGNSVVAVYK